jgi:hypothetical protein
MSLLTTHLSSWMIVSLLLCMLLLICFPVIAQVNKSVHIADTGSMRTGSLAATDSVHLKKDSLLKKILTPSISLAKSVKNSRHQLKQLYKNNFGKTGDTLPSLKEIISSKTKSFIPRLREDSTKPSLDSSFKHLLKSEKDKFAGLFHFKHKPGKDSAVASQKITETNHFFSKPLIGFQGGYVNYDYNYRSSIDTPFAEQNISQHNISGNIGTVIANTLPFRINFWIRRSNSVLYQDITDIQVSFDAAGFRNQLVNNLQKRLQAFKPSEKDSLLEKMAALKSLQKINLRNWMIEPFNVQRIHEYKELIAIDQNHPENKPSDSSTRKIYDAQLKMATTFIQLYDSSRLRYDSLSSSVDSLEKEVFLQRKKLNRYRQLVNGKFTDWTSYNKWKDDLSKTDPGGLAVPDKYKWLMGIRNFNLGKTPVNYSELSAKNISLKGINFEYNTWYYLAVSAGLIDYRFRDFVAAPVKHSPQYLLMVRAGLGRIERNYFIVTLFKGQKQLYNLPVNSQIGNSISITGVTAETKWQAGTHTYFIAEAGESMAPNYWTNPVQGSEKFSFTGNTNKALSVKFYSSFPKLGARAEGMYKYTGANYQSFSSFQTNAAVKSWYLKWDQSFLKRKLRITASLRSSEFTNPYIIQDYKSNTVFKSISAVFRMRKWPVISVGYIPMSQFSVIGQQVMESRFQTLTASMNHIYKIGDRQAFTTIVYNRFFNGSTDTGFIYFNATNFYLSQTMVFRLFTASLGIADSKSNQYNLISEEISVRIPVTKKIVIGMGTKIYNLNKQETNIGGKFSVETALTKKDRIGINYDKSYLPGTGKQLVNNEMGNIHYSRYF